MLRRETTEAEKACSFIQGIKVFLPRRSGLLPLEQENRGSHRSIPNRFGKIAEQPIDINFC